MEIVLIIENSVSLIMKFFIELYLLVVLKPYSSKDFNYLEIKVYTYYAFNLSSWHVRNVLKGNLRKPRFTISTWSYNYVLYVISALHLCYYLVHNVLTTCLFILWRMYLISLVCTMYKVKLTLLFVVMNNDLFVLLRSNRQLLEILHRHYFSSQAYSKCW